VAVDWHLVPSDGRPRHSRNEVYCGKPQQGTTRFHAYSTACVVQSGKRYTVALTWVHRHETGAAVLRRLCARGDDDHVQPVVQAATRVVAGGEVVQDRGGVGGGHDSPP
jgi:hypothetical protein